MHQIIMIKTMSKLPYFMLTAALAFSISGVAEENDGGWISLFDGKTLNGWKGYNDAEINGKWMAKDGTLHLDSVPDSKPYTNIITEQQFDDFDLLFEWKIEKGTNSGVMFHVGEGPPQPYLTGPEYQVLDNEGFRNGKGEPVTEAEKTGSHYAVEPATSDETKPIGEWNQSRIVVKGNHVEYYTNGVKTANYKMHSEKWKGQIANAKFSKWKDYATLGKGHIGLQDHGHKVWFRNLKIKEL
ncbi:MAG: hypothetical protein CMO61_09775 [Verrucomicrobiales bacterium]|nr:hypothetical protein [Verrucomicrobiales bacterium]|tara:strand:+ start:18110 stop:18832 length:723 start_codon:yes stop_codon:yes gene_type:complete